MSWLYGTLRDRVRNKEEVKLSVLYFTLLNEAGIDVSALRRVLDELVALGSLSLLEESLAHALVDDDKSNLRRSDRSWNLLTLLFCSLSRGAILLLLEDTVLFGDDLVKLVQLFVNNHLSHGITDTITVDEDMLGHGAVEVAVTLEGTLEIVGQDTARDNFLTFLWLRGSLCIVLTEVRIISCTESNSTLLTLMAHIDTHKHGSFRDFGAKAHAPQVSSNLGVHLSDDVHENTIVVFSNGTVSHKLRDHRSLTVDFILKERIEVLMVRVIRHDYQEDKSGLSTSCDVRLYA